jgi:hypothetical protein
MERKGREGHGARASENTDEITLSSLGVHFSLADAYIDVEFEESTEEA